MNGIDEAQFVEAARKRAQLLAHRHRAEEGLRVLTEALTSFPGNALLLADRAWLLCRLDRIDAAVAAAHASLASSPHNYSGLFQLATAYKLRKDYALAEETLHQALQRWPQDPDLHAQLARVIVAPYNDTSRPARSKEERESDRVRAYTHFLKALEFAPEDPDHYETAAYVSSTFHEDCVEALGYVDQGLALSPEHSGLRAFRAYALPRAMEGKGTKPGYVIQVEEAGRTLQSDPENIDARSRIFQLFWRSHARALDASIVGLAIVAVTLALSVDNENHAPLIWGSIVAGFSIWPRIIGYRRLMATIDPRYRQNLLHSSAHSRLRAVLGRIAFLTTVALAVALPYLPTAILVPWVLVLLVCAVLVSFTATMILTSEFRATLERSGGGIADRVYITTSEQYRGYLWIRFSWRAVESAVGLSLLAGAHVRDDTRAVAYTAIAAALLAPLVGVIATGITERERFAKLPEGSAIPLSQQVPRVWVLVTAIALAGMICAALIVNLVSLPALLYPQAASIAG